METIQGTFLLIQVANQENSSPKPSLPILPCTKITIQLLIISHFVIRPRQQKYHQSL